MNPITSRRPLRSAVLAVATAAALVLTGAFAAAPATAAPTRSASASSPADAGATPAQAAAAKPTVDRISGADRYTVAVNISKAAYPDGNGVAYLVTGANYPDALGAAPAAVHTNGPLLLTTTASIPSVVLAELNRLAPNLVIVVGGSNSVSPAVVSQLGTVDSHPNVTRITGTDRYDTSRNLIDFAYGTAHAPTIYVATGANFPDALSAGAAGGAADAPVLLVDGKKNGIDAPTSGTLTSSDYFTAKIAGGTSAVSTGIQDDIDYLIDKVVRLAGADRYQASIAINRDAFTSADRVFLATGTAFPDALAGAAWAGKVKAPLFVVPGTCVPSGVLSEISNLGATRVTLLGGEAALSPSVQALQPCGGPE